MEKVLIISGSKSDEEIAKQSIAVLDAFGVPNRYEVASAHRNPEKVESLVRNSTASVFICIAGLSAALPGVVASKTTKPVIGVPVNAAVGGLDSLLSIAQMPPNVPCSQSRFWRSPTPRSRPGLPNSRRNSNNRTDSKDKQNTARPGRLL
jgi:5-(carboxyamino)imidazole ribonucleotide mutase